MRKIPDHRLMLRPIKVQFRTGGITNGTAEGNNAAWSCSCGGLLVGRCYFQFGHSCHTTCPDCGKTYRVKGDDRKKAVGVVEIAA